QVAAGYRRDEMAEKTSSQLRSKQHRHFAGRYRPRAQAPHGALGGAPANRLRIQQRLTNTVDVVEVVALHLAFAFSDHYATQAVPAAAITTDKAIAVAIGTTALMGVEAGAIRI